VQLIKLFAELPSWSKM